MAIYINEDDAKLFQQNGFSYDDVNDTVEHYRESGIKDDEIQKKIDARITQFKNAANNNTSSTMFNQEALGLEKVKPSEIYATPKRNALTDFLNCLQWVKNASVSAWGEGLNQAEIANLEAKDMFHTINTQEKNRLEELENAPAKQYGKDYKIIENRFADKNADTFIADLPNNTKKAYIEAVKMLPYMWETIKAGGIGGAGGAIIGAGTGLATGLLTTKANTPQLVAQGARTGLSIGSRITGAGKIAELEGGLARSELKQINKDTIEKGGEPLTEAELNALAIGVGTINAGLEVIGLKQVLKTIPNGDKILQYIEKKQLRELVSDATVRGQLKNALKQYGKAIGTEVSTEIAQEATNIAADHLAQKLGNIDFENQDFSKDLSRLVDTGKATFGAMVFIGGFGTAAKATSIMVKQGLTKEEAEAKTAEMTPEEQQDFVEENFDTLMEIAKDVDIDEREKVVSQLSEKFQQEGNLLKDKTLANGTAELFTRGLEVVSEANGIPLETLMQNAMPKVVDEAEDKKYQDMADYYEEYAERSGLMQEAQKLYQEMNELDKTGTEYNEPIINIGGVDRQTTNSEGRPIAKTKEAIEHFYNWFGDSKAVDEEGKPIVVYHGSVNTFEIFDKSKASPEGDMGAGFYFTSSEWDADDNYHGGGPDFENKVARLAEQLQAEDEELDYDEAKEQAEAQLMGEPHQFACYLKMENPCYIGENETRLLEDIYERVAEIKEEDYEDYDEYEQARMEAEDEALNDIAYDIDAALGGFNISYDDAQAIKQAVFDGIYESGVSVEELKKKIQDLYIEDNEGNLVNNEVVRSVVEALGYDGIIDTTVADKFNMNIPYGTAHYIVFNPEQIKSVDNRGTFDANNPNIYYQSAQTAGTEEGEEADAAKEWKEKGTDSKYFKRWFGNSKIVDKNRKPLIVYHGTNADFEKFEIGDIGYHFGNIEQATERMTDFTDGNPHIVSGYIKMENPLDIVSDVGDWLDVDSVKEYLHEYEILSDEEFKNINTLSQITSLLQNKGYDGIIYENQFEGKGKSYIIFNSSQFKSVDNRGTFDTNNPNIYYQSAYHGTPHKFDEFSTENIGTGEGNQAHGWGLYFAADKEVSDSYRAGLTEDILYPDKILVNDTEYVRQEKPLGYYDKDGNAMPSVYSRAVGFIRDYGNAKMAAKGADAKINLLKRELEMSGGKRADEIKTEIKEYEELKNVLEKDKIKEINGQLFEVDVPEDKVLLDEDKNFREQPEKVRKAIIKLAHDEKIPISYFANASGKEIYERIGKFISMKIGRAEKTSKLLNEYGVKGITYDGKQDGRCYVVFDDKAIKVLKKYYQAEKAPAMVTPVNIDVDSVPNFDKVSDLKKWIQDNLNLLGDVEIKSNGRTVQFSKSNIARSMKGINRNQAKRDSYSGLRELVENAEYSYTKDADSRHSQRNKGQEIYHNAFNYNGKTYGIEISIDIPISEKSKHSYAGHKIKVLGITEVSSNEGLLDSTSTNISITDIRRLFNPEAYNQDNESGNADAMKNVKGYYIPAEKIIVLLKNADASTIAHEWAHWYLDLLQNNSDNEIIAEKLEAVRKLVKNEGEEFTEEQHEKFARAFEVYLRSGYAKNNKLKQVFEDFKNFLWSIYDSVMNIVYKENGVDKTFTDEEIKNIKDIFDNLLTTERERIKSTVFDKIEEIDNKIEEIKNHEAEEFKELDSIWRDNIALMDRKSDKKRKVKEYIELAEKMTSRDTKEVREWKKRYKDATLDILAAVSGKSRSWVANSRNWEKLQDIIGGAGDEITTSGGFRPEWSEFYADTGVSYENDEIDGDYKLAEQAFSVMTDGNYDGVYGENYEFADIDRYVSKLDYLAAKVKTLKGTEKEAAFEAFCEVFGNMPEMPEEIAAEVAQKIPEMEEVYETQQRDDFNKKVYPSIPVVQQLQWYITNKLNELKVYNPETRYKMRLNRSHRLYRYIKNINSVDAAKKQIRRINEYVIDDMRNNQRSLLSKEIQKQIKVNSKVVKVGSLTKGKFDWKTNTVFAELVQLNKLSREEAEKQLGAMVNIDNAANSEARDSFDEADSGEFNKTGDFQAVLRNEFLQYRSQKLQDLDVAHTIQLLQDILELKEKGRKAKSEEDFLNKTQRWNTKNNLLDVLEETKQSGTQFGANWIAGVGRVAGLNGGVLANWESLLNAIFNRETAQKYSLLLDEARSEVYARRHMLHFYKKASDIYGFKSPSNWDKFIDFDYLQPIIDLMREYDNEKYTYTQKVFSINTPSGYAESSIEISRAQMITMFAWSLNDELEQRLFNQFGVQQIMDMFESKLSKEDKELAWALVDTCETMREDINEVFIRTTGLSLPKVQNYFPSKAERVQSDIDLYHDFFVKSSNPSFIKERKSCHRIPMKPMAPLEILIPHINKTAKYVILSEKTNFMNQVFKDTAIKTKIQEIWGSDNGAKIYQTLINKLAACTFTNYAKGTNLVASALDTVSRNYISSRIGFSGKVALGQLLSVVNYAENMPAAAWAKGFKETIKHPVESFKYMLENCEYLQSRLAGNTQNEIISILTSEKDRFRKLRNFMSTNTKWGDIIAITLGGKPYVDYLMEQGMTKEEAFDKFLEDTLRAQQAGTTSSISEWQSAQAQNCLTRMIFAFQNTTIQYERKFIDTLIQAKKGELSKSEAAKKLFIYKILNPIMFTSFLGNLSLLALFRGLAGGDDDEPVGFLKSVIESIFLSGFGAYGFAGFFSSAVVESIIANLDSGYKHFDKAIPIYSDFNREIQKWVKGDLEFADYVEALAFASDYGAGVAGTKVINAAGGLGNIAQGQFGVGLTRMAGWGEYTSTKAWTGEEPERKKKKRK